MSAEARIDNAVKFIEEEKFHEAYLELIWFSKEEHPEVNALLTYINCREDEQNGMVSGARAQLLRRDITDDYSGVLKEEMIAYRNDYNSKYKDYYPGLEEKKNKEADENKKSTPTKVPYKPKDDKEDQAQRRKDDPYDVYEYNDEEEFYYENKDDFESFEDAEALR